MSEKFLSKLILLSLPFLLQAPAFCQAAGSQLKAKTSEEMKKGSGASVAKKQARGKTSKSSRKTRGARIAHGLVPPPPAYMPSILPEMYYQNEYEEAELDEAEELPAKKVNPYSKYFYSSSNQVPKAVQARSGVSTWVQSH